MIYVDVTHLRQFFAIGRALTGIQRVTMEVVTGLNQFTKGRQVSLLRYSQKRNCIQTAPVQLFDELLGARGNKEAFAERETVGSNRWREPAMQPGDVLLLTESLGDDQRYHAYEELKAAHALRVFQVIYDIIPLTRPDYCVKIDVIRFRNVIPIALSLADEVICISEFTRRDLLRTCGDMIPKYTPIHVWRLAHEFPVPQASSGELPGIVRKPFALFSGTIEDRKNQHRAVKAWRKLARNHNRQMPQLVLAGGWGKLSRATILTRIAAYAELHNEMNIVVLNQVDDATLRALYDNCQFTVYISSYEGWGLPIGESLWCEKPVLATTRTSLPEVGGSLADYCDPDDESDLMAAIEKLAFDDGYRQSRIRAIRNASLRDWKTAASSLLHLMDTDLTAEGHA